MLRAQRHRRSRHRCHRSPGLSESLESRLLLTSITSSASSAMDAGSSIFEAEVRTIDGVDNNVSNPEQGAAETRVIRFGYPAVYPDGFGDEIEVADQPNARDISNSINAQDESIVNDRYLTDWIVQWGQFLTHDLALTLNSADSNILSDGTTGDFSIAINDPADPLGPNSIPLNRSSFDPETGTDELIDSPFGLRPNWREQINSVTSYIDASNVYGSDAERAAALRTFVDGKLRLSEDGLLPLNTDNLNNDDPLRLGDQLYLAGDVRANEQVGLTALHVVFAREHNRLADLIKAQDDSLTDEQIYQLARRIVSAEMQIVTYEEFLPALLGDTAPDARDYAYDETVNASITNSFATAIFRYGHSMQSASLQLVDNDGNNVGQLSLADAFFNPSFLGDNPDNVDLVLNGLASQTARENDLYLVDEVRNFLFGPPGAGGLDLAALDIQRGRDHGLPDYNSLREFYGLERVTSFDEITSDPAIQARLQELYGSVDSIDAFIGAIAEDHMPGSSAGELVNAVTVNQFERLRDGDRFFYVGDDVLQSEFVRSVIDLNHVTLSEVLQQNTGLTNLQDNVFFSDTVLYYRAQDGSANVVVTVRGDDVVLIDRRSGRVIDSRPAEMLEQIILVGTDSGRGDHFAVDGRVAEMAIPGGIVVSGGDSERDVLELQGTRGDDSVTVDQGRLTFNAATIQFTGIEFVRINLRQGDDQISIADDTDFQVSVVDSHLGRAQRPGTTSGRRGTPAGSSRASSRTIRSLSGPSGGLVPSDVDTVFEQLSVDPLPPESPRRVGGLRPSRRR